MKLARSMKGVIGLLLGLVSIANLILLIAQDKEKNANILVIMKIKLKD